MLITKEISILLFSTFFFILNLKPPQISLFLQDGGLLISNPIELVAGRHFQLGFINFILFGIKYVLLLQNLVFCSVKSVFSVLVYLISFAVWLVDEDTLASYTLPKLEEVLREKIVYTALDFQGQ